MNKPIVIFTNFFDCQNIFLLGGFILSNKNKLYSVRVNDENSKVYSLSLTLPELELPNVNNVDILPILCPTIRNYRNLKLDNDWVSFRKQYYQTLMKRKDKINKFLDSLSGDKVYFICSIENTSFGCTSIRKWIYETLSHGKAKDKALYIYRDGIFQDQMYSKDNGHTVRGHRVVPDFSVDTFGMGTFADITARRFPIMQNAPITIEEVEASSNLTLRAVHLSSIPEQPNYGGDWFTMRVDRTQTAPNYVPTDADLSEEEDLFSGDNADILF